MTMLKSYTKQPRDIALSGRPWMVSLVATVAVLIFVCGFARMFNDSFRGNDDAVYFYQAALEMRHADKTAPLHNHVRKYLAAHTSSDVARRRWDLRVQYSQNYLMMNAFIYGSSRALREFFGSLPVAYPLLVSLSIAIGVILGAIVSVSVLRWAIIRVGDLATASGVALGLAILGACSLVPLIPLENPFGSVSWRLLDGTTLAPASAPSIASVADSAWYLFFTFVGGGSEYSIFGYTPRSQLYLIALAAFLLRWNGAWTAAYAIVVALAVVHQSMAALVLAMFIAIDVIARPYIFNQWIIALCAVGIGLELYRETLFADFGMWPFIATMVGAGAGVFAVSALIARSGIRIPFHQTAIRITAPCRRLLERLGPIGSDLVLGMACALGTIPIAIVMCRIADPLSALTFWSWLPIRLMMIVQPAVFVGLSILLIRWLAIRTGAERWIYPIAITAAIAVSAPVSYRTVGNAPVAGTGDLRDRSIHPAPG